MPNNFWIIEWEDIRGDANRAINTVATFPEEAVERIRMLESNRGRDRVADTRASFCLSAPCTDCLVRSRQRCAFSTSAHGSQFR